MTPEEEREQNRQRMPTVAQWMDETRALFGNGVRLTAARENGFELGPQQLLDELKADAARSRATRATRG